MRAGTLTYMERYSMTPATGSPGRRWIADEACYVGTVLAAGGAVNRSLVREVHEKLQARSGVRASADLVEEQLLLLRLVGSEGTAFHQARALSTAALTTRNVRLQADRGKSG
jgi:urease accessory protein UreH